MEEEEEEEEEEKEKIRKEEEKEEVKTDIISFLEKIIKLSNIQIPLEKNWEFTEEETTIITPGMIADFEKRFVPGKSYFNSDCKPDNFCYQKKSDDVTIKIMDVSVYLFYEVAGKDTFNVDKGEVNIQITKDILRCYVFLLYFGKIVYYYHHKKENINLILEIFKQISSKFVTKDALQFIYDNLGKYHQLSEGVLNWNSDTRPAPDKTKGAFINNINRFIDATLIPGEKEASPTGVDKVHEAKRTPISSKPRDSNPFARSGKKAKEPRKRGPTVQPTVHQDHRRAHNPLNNRLREQILYDHHTTLPQSQTIFMFGNNDRYGHK